MHAPTLQPPSSSSRFAAMGVACIIQPHRIVKLPGRGAEPVRAGWAVLQRAPKGRGSCGSLGGCLRLLLGSCASPA